VFERFYRADQSKPNSSGLGLAIVKEICDSLGAAIHLRNASGGGLQVEVRVPLAQP
jgi:signal transduction histidine kinase